METTETTYLADLERRYRLAARQRVEAKLDEAAAVPYDDLVALALGAPMTSEAELKQWLTDLRGAGRVRFEGLAPRELVPKVGKGHRIVRIAPR